MAQFIGTISKITGTVIARAPDGAIRELQLGDDVYQGEVLITAQGAIVEVTVPDAPAIVLPGGRELLLNGEVTVADRDTAAEDVGDLAAASRTAGVVGARRRDAHRAAVRVGDL